LASSSFEGEDSAGAAFKGASFGDAFRNENTSNPIKKPRAAQIIIKSALGISTPQTRKVRSTSSAFCKMKITNRMIKATIRIEYKRFI
jgi:hypothetical protein